MIIAIVRNRREVGIIVILKNFNFDFFFLFQLNRVHNKFKELELSIEALREWINSTVEILRVLLNDDESIEESMKQVEV